MSLKKKILSAFAMIFAIGTLFSYTVAFADTVVVITKNPTSESVTVGGKTWFIAHADNALSLTWEIIDPNGYVYSLADAIALNPGLGLQALEGDTLAVSNVPLSFNGWGIQARFDGQGNSATTSPAYIYVGDFLGAYSSIIEKYKIARTVGIHNYMDSENYDVCEFTSSYGNLGYALKDLDKNGIPELLIFGYETDPALSEHHQLLDLYSLFNNSPVRICESANRSNLNLLSDNRIYWRSSGGASIAIHDFYNVNGTELQFIERYFSYYDSEQFGHYFYHMSADYNDFLTWHPELYDGRIPIEEFTPVLDQYMVKIWMPQLTSIS